MLPLAQAPSYLPALGLFAHQPAVQGQHAGPQGPGATPAPSAVLKTVGPHMQHNCDVAFAGNNIKQDKQIPVS